MTPVLDAFKLPDPPPKKRDWIKVYWRPVMAWQYTAVCVFDFIVGPCLTMLFYKVTGGTYVPWVPLTLANGGFYHMAMMTIVGVAAWSRGQEKMVMWSHGIDGDPEDERRRERDRDREDRKDPC